MKTFPRTRLVSATLISIVLIFNTTGCRKPLAKLSLGIGTASFDAPSGILTAIPIANDGTRAAEDVEVSSVSIAGATLRLPVSLPSNLGRIAPDSSSTLNANFTSPDAKPDTDYKVTVDGSFREHGHKFKFSLEQTVRTPPAPGSATAHTGTAPTQKVTGAPYPAAPPNFPKEVNEGNHSRQIPTGPERPLVPSKQSEVKSAPHGAGGGGGSASINFPTNDPVGINANTIAEPSGATGGGVVFETANSYAAYSTDGGSSFTKLNPTTIFPNNSAGGFCCDQIVQYAASIDRFIWVMQYSQSHLATDAPGSSTGPNLYRIAAASPSDVISSKGTSWSYFDITSTALGATAAGAWIDYPDTSIGDNNFYLSTDNVNVGRIVVRVPLSDIKAGGTINFGFTDFANGGVAYASHVTQNTRDEVFWAGHNNNSSIRIFNWPESSNQYSWRDINIGSWPKVNSTTLMTSTTPDGQDWLTKLSGFPGNGVLGLARSAPGKNDRGGGANLLYFAWSGAIGNGFPQPQVQWIAVDRNNNFALVSQNQVWNPGYAYAYPAFAVNTNNEIGMSLEWGGGGNYENHVAGFWGDFVVYETTNSNIGTTRFGDYVTIRQNFSDPTKFDAFGYGLNQTSPPGGSTVDTHYIVFSR